MANSPLPPGLRRCIVQLGLPEGDTLNWELLVQALTHASASAQSNNERLEFMGDAVLRLAAAEFLMEQYPDASVGELSTLRSHLVSDQTLADIAETIGLESFLEMSSAALGDCAARPTQLADAMEAILAVLYRTRGNLTLVRQWLDPHLETRTHQLRQNPERYNPKTTLQEWLQKHYKALPEYRTTEVSLAHGDTERFRAEVWFQERCLGIGLGASRKAAEQAAALQGYQVLLDDSLEN